MKCYSDTLVLWNKSCIDLIENNLLNITFMETVVCCAVAREKTTRCFYHESHNWIGGTEISLRRFSMHPYPFFKKIIQIIIEWKFSKIYLQFFKWNMQETNAEKNAELWTLELVSKELNHLAAILHVYAGVWFLWSKKKLLFFKKKREILLHF